MLQMNTYKWIASLFIALCFTSTAIAQNYLIYEGSDALEHHLGNSFLINRSLIMGTAHPQLQLSSDSELTDESFLALHEEFVNFYPVSFLHDDYDIVIPNNNISPHTIRATYISYNQEQNISAQLQIKYTYTYTKLSHDSQIISIEVLGPEQVEMNETAWVEFIQEKQIEEQAQSAQRRPSAPPRRETGEWKKALRNFAEKVKQKNTPK
jgi:hypothetical protein